MKSFILALSLAASTALAPVAVKAHSLADALAHAYTHSKLLEQQRFLLRATDEDVAVAVSSLRPSISFFTRQTWRFSNGAGDNLTTLLGLQLDWTLLDAGQRASRIQAARETVLAARFGLVDLEQQVLSGAALAFLQLRQNLQTVALRENNLRLIRQQLQAARDRFEVGEVTRTDVSIAEARLASAQSALAAARGQVAVSREAYKLATGQAPHGLTAPPTPPKLPKSLSAARNIALRTHPSISQLQHTVRALEFVAAAAEQDRLGTLNLGANVSTGYRTQSARNTRSSNGEVTLTFNQPLYTGGRLSALSRKAMAQLHASRAQLAQQGLVISDGVGQAWARLDIARAQVTANRQQVRAARLAFDGTREEALLGARTTLDVLNAEQELLDAQTAVLDAETQAYIAVYNVLASMGLLTTSHLGLSVQRYDPTDYYNAVANAPAIPRQHGSDLDNRLNAIRDRYVD